MIVMLIALLLPSISFAEILAELDENSITYRKRNPEDNQVITFSKTNVTVNGVSYSYNNLWQERILTKRLNLAYAIKENESPCLKIIQKVEVKARPFASSEQFRQFLLCENVVIEQDKNFAKTLITPGFHGKSKGLKASYVTWNSLLSLASTVSQFSYFPSLDKEKALKLVEEKIVHSDHINNYIDLIRNELSSNFEIEDRNQSVLSSNEINHAIESYTLLVKQIQESQRSNKEKERLQKEIFIAKDLLQKLGKHKVTLDKKVSNYELGRLITIPGLYLGYIGDTNKGLLGYNFLDVESKYLLYWGKERIEFKKPVKHAMSKGYTEELVEKNSELLKSLYSLEENGLDFNGCYTNYSYYADVYYNSQKYKTRIIDWISTPFQQREKHYFTPSTWHSNNLAWRHDLKAKDLDELKEKLEKKEDSNLCYFEKESIESAIDAIIKNLNEASIVDSNLLNEDI